MNLGDLKEICKHFGIKGISKYKKEGLVDHLLNFMTEKNDTDLIMEYSVDLLISRLEEGDYNSRLEVAKVLSLFKNPKAILPLINLLVENDDTFKLHDKFEEELEILEITLTPEKSYELSPSKFKERQILINSYQSFTLGEKVEDLMHERGDIIKIFISLCIKNIKFLISLLGSTNPRIRMGAAKILESFSFIFNLEDYVDICPKCGMPINYNDSLQTPECDCGYSELLDGYENPEEDEIRSCIHCGNPFYFKELDQKQVCRCHYGMDLDSEREMDDDLTDTAALIENEEIGSKKGKLNKENGMSIALKLLDFLK